MLQEYGRIRRSPGAKLHPEYATEVHGPERHRTYYLKDHLGNVRVTVNEDGDPIGWDDYYPFGKVMPGRSSNNANPNDLYKYTGHERDTEANLNLDYMGARYYDPEIGRFLQVDPLADEFPGWSPYNYTMNNPLKYTEPTGMAPEECPPWDFEYLTRSLFQNYDNTYIGDLFRADAQGQLDQKVSQDLKDAGNATVDAVGEFADKASELLH